MSFIIQKDLATRCKEGCAHELEWFRNETQTTSLGTWKRITVDMEKVTHVNF